MVVKATIISDVFTLIYDRMVANVTSVEITGGTTVTIQTYTNSFPDKPLSTKSDYPILVVLSPQLNWKEFTFTKKEVEGTFAIEIYTTQNESADKLLDAIIESIETYRTDLRDDGLSFVNLEGTDKDDFERDKINVHMRSAEFSFKYKFTKTRSY